MAILEQTQHQSGLEEAIAIGWQREYAKVDVRAKIGAQHNRADFGGVCGRQSLENAPRDAAEDLTDQEGLDVLGEEWDEDEADHSKERNHHSSPVAIFLRNDAVDEQTKDLANESTIGQSRLSTRRDCIRAIFSEDSIFLVKLW